MCRKYTCDVFRHMGTNGRSELFKMYSDEENNEDKKMKVVIVTAGILPVPATKGGAIETRVTYLADENERIGLWNLEICSIYEKCAEKESQNADYGNARNGRSFVWNQCDGGRFGCLSRKSAG